MHVDHPAPKLPATIDGTTDRPEPVTQPGATRAECGRPGKVIRVAPATDLAPLVGLPVTFTRQVNGTTYHYVGVFTKLAHNQDNPRPEFRRGDAGGTFEYLEDGQRRSTGMHVPYGSTIAVAA
jgi:hypothetical protein